MIPFLKWVCDNLPIFPKTVKIFVASWSPLIRTPLKSLPTSGGRAEGRRPRPTQGRGHPSTTQRRPTRSVSWAQGVLPPRRESGKRCHCRGPETQTRGRLRPTYCRPWGGGLGVTAPEDRRERGPQSQQSASAKPCLGRESLPAVSQTHGHRCPAAGPVHTCLSGAPAATEIHDPHRNGLQTPPGQALEPVHIPTLGKRKPTRGVVSTHRGRVWEPNAVTQCVLHV